jgi:hypothetical protein
MRKSVILKVLSEEGVVGGRGLLKGKDLRTREATAQGMIAWNYVFVNRYWEVLFESAGRREKRFTAEAAEDTEWRRGVVAGEIVEGGVVDSERKERVRDEADILPSWGAACCAPTRTGGAAIAGAC